MLNFLKRIFGATENVVENMDPDERSGLEGVGQAWLNGQPIDFKQVTNILKYDPTVGNYVEEFQNYDGANNDEDNSSQS